MTAKAAVLLSAALAWGLAFAPAEAQTAPERALADVDGLFDGYYAWFGSMHDRQTGGAYHSAGARARPDLFTPHIESTSKYTRVIEWSGLVDAVPAAVRDGVVGFIRAKQIGGPAYPDHAYTGFFLDGNYANLSPADDGAGVGLGRASRALGFSTGILDLFGATPAYDLPDAGSNPEALPHLQSGAAFRGWLEERSWDRSWTAGSDLLTQSGSIERLEAPLREEVLAAAWDYLENTQQDAATGLWGDLDRGDNTRDYIALNGAHKIVAFYDNFGRAVPHADALMDTALAEVQTADATNLLFTYNASQLVQNLKEGSDAAVSDAELGAFIEREAVNLSRFRRADGGFSTRTAGGTPANEFQPAIDTPMSNTDVSGLALKTRDSLHDLVKGSHGALASAGDPRLFGMSGANSGVLVGYAFGGKSLTADAAAGIAASKFGAVGTHAGSGPSGDGFYEGGGGANDFAIGHSGFDGGTGFYTFTVDFGDAGEAVDLYFLALRVRHGGGWGVETLVVEYAVDGGGFSEAGRTTLPGGDVGPVVRDVPLLTIDKLQDLGGEVTFRIRGLGFANPGRSFRVDDVRLFGVVPEPASASAGVALLGGVVLFRRRGRVGPRRT